MTLEAQQLIKLLSIGGPKTLTTLGQALYREGATIFEESQDEVPVDTTNLKKSGNLELPIIQGSEVVVEIYYGGAAADYALAVHEDMERTYRNGKKSKYLEDPVKRHIKGLDARILSAVRKAMGI